MRSGQTVVSCCSFATDSESEGDSLKTSLAPHEGRSKQDSVRACGHKDGDHLKTPGESSRCQLGCFILLQDAFKLS